jgi:hypothetical protein
MTRGVIVRFSFGCSFSATRPPVRVPSLTSLSTDPPGRIASM